MSAIGTYNVEKEVALREQRKQNTSSRSYSVKHGNKEKRRKSNVRRKTVVSKFWFKIFSEELGVPVRLSGRIASFLAQIPVKNRKQLREWLEEHRIGGVLGIKNFGPCKLKILTRAVDSASASPKSAKVVPFEYRKVEEVVEQVVTEESVGDVRIKVGKFKGHDTVTLHRDGIPIVSFGRKKALAILDVVDNPAALSVLVKFAGAVNPPPQSAQNGQLPGERKMHQTFNEMVTAGEEKTTCALAKRGFDILEDIVSTLGVQTEMGREFVMVAMECIELFDKKQRDYGSANITMSGGAGLAFRLLDKACRLQNLIQQREKDGLPPENESIEDSLLDSANLGMIGILVTRGFWK